MNMDEVFEKAKDAVNIAAKKTEEVVNISKLKLETVKVNNEIKSLYEKLGRSVYQSRGKSGNSNEDTVHSLCEEIDELLSKLDALNKEIAELKNVTVCPGCGQNNPKENVYCSKCGARIKEEVGFDAEVSAEEESEE
ncbi:zinc ribbon domain-containing protein [Massiliimalia massiliensis]|uniref:zinc ribbon domain-containing protein n=1 Tax=Massiliimalia massiliensis TaxID=1852384 RepID=UPI000986B369|nr:zinc ribbon domain-containing protein [Massiliimalia massiliensis]